MREIIEALTLRIRSPIFGYFVFAFFTLNWKPVFFLLVSNEDPLVRIEYFEKNSTLASTVWWPVLIAPVLGLLYPWLQLAVLKLIQLPTRLRNEIFAENEHSHLSKKLELERLRGELTAEKERQLIDRSKRDQEVDELTDDNLKQDLKAELHELRRGRYGDKDMPLLEAAYEGLGQLGIKADKVSTTGGSTGVRVWISSNVPHEQFNLLHEEIVSFHGKPIELEVHDYKSDEEIYRSQRPKFLEKKA